MIITRYLSLDGLQELTPEAARALASWLREPIYLFDKSKMTQEMAETLFETMISIVVSLDGVRDFSEKAEDELRKWAGLQGRRSIVNSKFAL